MNVYVYEEYWKFWIRRNENKSDHQFNRQINCSFFQVCSRTEQPITSQLCDFAILATDLSLAPDRSTIVVADHLPSIIGLLNTPELFVEETRPLVTC